MTTSTLKLTPTRPGPDRPRPLGEISRRSRRLISVLLSSRRYEAPSLQARPSHRTDICILPQIGTIERHYRCCITCSVCLDSCCATDYANQICVEEDHRVEAGAVDRRELAAVQNDSDVTDIDAIFHLCSERQMFVPQGEPA